ncbi:HIT domain-containing protein [Cognatilysobacter segetis]|uniref:HIT domain-containing protein n=1 Tax=Cognatilysobacter segetis TaxID=2492394 RepID=UPI00105E7281|nr:HIT domain-containing protein [Lysobacter segetis]
MTAGWSLHPRLESDSVAVATLPLSDVRLMDNAHYPWLVLVPRIAGAVEWIDLDERDRHRLLDETTRCANALRVVGQVDKLNIAAIGNVVSQLHVHVVARRNDDACWPSPVWGGPALPYAPAARDALVARLRGLIGAA